MEIDKLAARFVALANKQNLSKAEHAEAQRLMRELKQAGMSNEEISKLSLGRWSQSSVKGYVTGVRAADPSPWQDAVSILNEAINKGISVDEIQSAVGIHDQLTSQGVTIEEVSDLLAAAKSAGVEVKALIEQHEDLKSDNLSTKHMKQALDLKTELEEHGLSLQSLPDVVKLAKNFGVVQVVLEAVSKYGTISELNEELAKTDKRLKSVKSELASETGCLDEAKANLIKLKEPLEAYGNLVKLGFSEAELRQLANITQKYGGVKRAFEAIKAYADYTEICNEISRAQATLTETKARIARLEEQHAHLKTAIEMCDNLIRTYKFGLDAIATIFSVAQKFGEPINVMRAIEAYGKLLSIQQEEIKLQARVPDLRKLIAELEARYQEMLDQLESLNARALNIGQDIGRLQSEIKQSKGLERILNLINDPESASYEEYGPLVLATVVSLRKFVLVHEQRFKFPGSIRSGLDGLIKDLGGK
jgi:chromosome segregation ATPase